MSINAAEVKDAYPRSDYSIISVSLGEVLNLPNILNQRTMIEPHNLDYFILEIAKTRTPIITGFEAFRELLQHKDSFDRTGLSQLNDRALGYPLIDKLAITGESVLGTRGGDHKVIATELRRAAEPVFTDTKDKFYGYLKGVAESGEVISVADIGDHLALLAGESLFRGAFSFDELKKIQDYIHLNLEVTTVPAMIASKVGELVYSGFGHETGVSVAQELHGVINRVENLRKGSGYFKKRREISNLMMEAVRREVINEDENINLIRAIYKTWEGDEDYRVRRTAKSALSIMQAALDTVGGTLSFQLGNLARSPELQERTRNLTVQTETLRESYEKNPHLVWQTLEAFNQGGQVLADARVVVEPFYLKGYGEVKSGEIIMINTAAIGKNFGDHLVKDYDKGTVNGVPVHEVTDKHPIFGLSGAERGVSFLPGSCLGAAYSKATHGGESESMGRILQEEYGLLPVSSGSSYTTPLRRDNVNVRFEKRSI